MIRMFVFHRCKDYPSWRKVYDDFEAARPGFGVIGHAVYRNPQDQNELTVTHDFGTFEEAQRFVGSDELRTAMMDAGVDGEPRIWFAEPV